MATVGRVCPFCDVAVKAEGPCPACGAWVRFPDGTSLHVSGDVADDVEKVAKGLMPAEPPQPTESTEGKDEHRTAWSAVGCALFAFAGAGAIALLTGSNRLWGPLPWILVGLAVVGAYIAVAPLLRLWPWRRSAIRDGSEGR